MSAGRWSSSGRPASRHSVEEAEGVAAAHAIKLRAARSHVVVRSARPSGLRQPARQRRVLCADSAVGDDSRARHAHLQVIPALPRCGGLPRGCRNAICLQIRLTSVAAEFMHPTGSVRAVSADLVSSWAAVRPLCDLSGERCWSGQQPLGRGVAASALRPRSWFPFRWLRGGGGVLAPVRLVRRTPV